MTHSSLSFVWLRRDLRLHDHAALSKALESPYHVQPVFIFDPDILSRFQNKEDRRLTFLMETCRILHKQLMARGGGLIIAYGKPREIWSQVASHFHASHLCWEEDYEPQTRARDDAIRQMLKGRITIHVVKDHVIHAPNEVLKEDGSPYKVFTPYSRQWRARFSPAMAAEYVIRDHGRYADYPSVREQFRSLGITILDLETSLEDLLRQIGYAKADITLWPVEDGGRRLSNFARTGISSYEDKRDFMGIHGTSRLSPYLRFGLVSVRECMRQALSSANAEGWINELIWREFYHMILYHFPHTPMLEFQPQYQGTIAWSQDRTLLQAFTQGRTGYPVVDAAMRELLTTGWMHNRARMIVASFMTKDLLLDWRLGEEHFAQHLMDYECASNVGGWQWAASTGTDAQPYFRIFNPVLQSKKFDPEGTYIRTYVPELAMLPDKDLHEPWVRARPANYPPPIVDHFEMRDRALAMFKQAEQKKRA